jgi:hypothetical protein
MSVCLVLAPVAIQVFSLTALPYKMLAIRCCVEQGGREKVVHSLFLHGDKPWKLRLPRVLRVPPRSGEVYSPLG